MFVWGQLRTRGVAAAKGQDAAQRQATAAATWKGQWDARQPAAGPSTAQCHVVGQPRLTRCRERLQRLCSCGEWQDVGMLWRL